MADPSTVASVADPRSKTQFSVRLYDRHWKILDRWERRLSPGMKADRSGLMRRILELTERYLDEEPEGVSR